jgi:hypothetical protein
MPNYGKGEDPSSYDKLFQDSLGSKGLNTRIVQGTVEAVRFDLERVRVSPDGLPGTVIISGEETDQGQGASSELQRIPRYSVDVSYPPLWNTLTDVPYLTPYSIGGTGDGIYFVPQEGSRCLLCFPEGSPDQAYVIGWYVGPSEYGGYSSGRLLMQEGEIAMRNGTGVIHMGRGGTVEVRAGSTCRRKYLPLAGLGPRIRDNASNYSLITSGGDMVWTKSDDGNFTSFRIMSSSTAGGRNLDPSFSTPFAGIQMGSHLPLNEADMRKHVPTIPMAPDDMVMTLTANNAANMFFDATGNVVMTGISSFGIYAGPESAQTEAPGLPEDQKVTGKMKVDLQHTINLETAGTMQLKSDGTMSITSAGQVLLTASRFITSGETRLGGGAFRIVREEVDTVVVTGVESGGSSAWGWATRGSDISRTI